ncbi:MAG: nucleoside triphosphate pyrophosphohydrolase, partial [Acutalibacteraceae bacterium]|nr:nucleoside triphosphate pyrophosphohydrolase [Acutalibacteraceae bacterium]
AVVNVSRFVKVDAEQALQSATDKFVKRFEKVENVCRERGIDMKSSTLEELDAIWDEIKH